MCGFIGLHAGENAAFEMADALLVLQHRGQDAAGIATFDGNAFHTERASGLVQEIFTAACAESGLAMQTRYDAKNPPALARLRETDIQIAPFPADVLRGSREASEALLEEQAAADAGYRKVHEAWKAFRRGAFDWFGTAELAYQQSAFG